MYVENILNTGPQFKAYMSNTSVIDRVPPDMQNLIHPYWGRFPPMESVYLQLIGTLSVVCFIISSIGNGMVIFIFGSTKALRTPANLLVLNLAISDICMMTSQCPIMLINYYYETWIVGPLWCDIYGAVGSLFGCVSIWSMCMIALDRYNVIVKGVAGRPMTIKLAILKILFVWSYGTFWTFIPFAGWSRYTPEGNLTACSIDYMTNTPEIRSYLVTYSIAVYFLPLTLICRSYYYIICAVVAHERAMREQAKKMNVRSLRSQEDSEKSAEAKLARVALTTIALWFTAWTPYLCIAYSGVLELDTLTPTISIWGAFFAKTSSVYNPIVYGLSHPKYRAALKARCPKCVFGFTEDSKPENSSTVESTTTLDAESKA